MNNPDIFNDEKELYLDWYRSYYPMVRKLVRERTGSRSEADAEDIFHDSVIVVIEKMRKNELYLTAKLSTYLHGIAENKCKEWLRRRKKENTVTLMDDFEEEEENGYDENKYQLVAQLRLCVEKLPETRKKIVLEYYWAKYKMEAIAEKYQFKNRDSVKSQKCKAIMDLKLKMYAKIKTVIRWNRNLCYR